MSITPTNSGVEELTNRYRWFNDNATNRHYQGL
jgi:hypothetical protein